MLSTLETPEMANADGAGGSPLSNPLFSEIASCTHVHCSAAGVAAAMCADVITGAPVDRETAETAVILFRRYQR